MFEAPPAYPAAFVPRSIGPDRVDEIGVAWALKQQAELGGTILLYRPQKDDFHQHPLLGDLVRRRLAIDASWRTLSNAAWSGGPVIAAWPDRQHLANIASDHRTKALVVLGWSDNDSEAWARAVQPEVLGSSVSFQSAEPNDSIVTAAMASLSLHVNQNNGLTTYDDRDAAIATLRTLRQHGHSLDAEDIYAWALANGWRDTTAERLRGLVTDINAGKNPRLRRNPFVPHIYDIWRRDASAPDGR